MKGAVRLLTGVMNAAPTMSFQAPLCKQMNRTHRVALLRSLSLSQPGRPAKSVEEVRQILHAIEQRDPEKAAAASREHVQNAAKAAFAGLIHQQNEKAAGDDRTRDVTINERR